VQLQNEIEGLQKEVAYMHESQQSMAQKALLHEHASSEARAARTCAGKESASGFVGGLQQLQSVLRASLAALAGNSLLNEFNTSCTQQLLPIGSCGSTRVARNSPCRKAAAAHARGCTALHLAHVPLQQLRRI
jgi:hypothetical protein